MAALWTGYDLQKALGVRVPDALVVQGIEFDSREVGAGDLFFALKGDAADGHAFVKDALERGAVAAVVEKDVKGLKEDPRLIRVEDVYEALLKLAMAARRRIRGKVIAVTGSAGKTSTKEALYAALSADGKTHASVKSYNNHVGVPVSLARMPADVDYAIFELGMNAPGEIGFLSRLVRPNLALVTTVGSAHRAGFESEKAIALAKAEIFEGLLKSGAAVLNEDNPYHDLLLAKAKDADIRTVKSCSAKTNSNADTTPVRIAHMSDCSCLTANILGDMVTYKVNLPGMHWIINSLMVLTAVKLVGGDMGLAALSLAGLQGFEGRGARHTVYLPDGPFVLIDESYNANPLSMAAVLDVLGRVEPGGRYGRRIAILADMAELGSEAKSLHLSLVNHIRKADVDSVLVLGSRMKEMLKCLPVNIDGKAFESKETLLGYLAKNLRPGDVVMVKGSNKFGLADVVDSLKAMGRSGEPEAKAA